MPSNTLRVNPCATALSLRGGAVQALDKTVFKTLHRSTAVVPFCQISYIQKGHCPHGIAPPMTGHWEYLILGDRSPPSLREKTTPPLNSSPRCKGVVGGQTRRKLRWCGGPGSGLCPSLWLRVKLPSLRVNCLSESDFSLRVDYPPSVLTRPWLLRRQ